MYQYSEKNLQNLHAMAHVLLPELYTAILQGSVIYLTLLFNLKK